MAVGVVCCELVSARSPDNGTFTGKVSFSPLPLCMNIYVSVCIYGAFMVQANLSATHKRDLLGNSSRPGDLAFVIQDQWRASHYRGSPAGMRH
jgi:hypothetical protein